MCLWVHLLLHTDIPCLDCGFPAALNFTSMLKTNGLFTHYTHYLVEWGLKVGVTLIGTNNIGTNNNPIQLNFPA